MGLSGGPLEKETGVCMEEVGESSSPATSSWGLDAVGVEEGETRMEDDRFTPAELEEKFRNMARMESALAGLGLPLGSRGRWAVRKSERLELRALGRARSEPVNESLPWLLEVLWGDLASTGDGGVLAGRANTHPKRPPCINPISTSEPELISADTRLSRRAKVT